MRAFVCYTAVLFVGCNYLASSSLAQNAIDASADGDAQRAVLVTGASSGIGRRITELLASDGTFVYAGARKQKDIDDLNRIENVQAIRLDVTIQVEIDAAVETVRAAGRGLYGVVNNAGVVNVGPLIEVEESDIHFLFDVNVYGPYRISKAFSPLLIEEKGRIVNISSISGVLSGNLFGAYSMSKHAVEAYTDSLAREMERFDVAVIAVEPGNYRSAIGRNMIERMRAQSFTAEGSAYADDINRIVGRFDADEESTDSSPEPDQVAEAVQHALFSATPKQHYMVVPEQRQAEITIRKAIEELVRYNEGHQFSYDRDRLVEMLDDALAE